MVSEPTGGREKKNDEKKMTMRSEVELLEERRWEIYWECDNEWALTWSWRNLSSRKREERVTGCHFRSLESWYLQLHMFSPVFHLRVCVSPRHSVRTVLLDCVSVSSKVWWLLYYAKWAASKRRTAEFERWNGEQWLFWRNSSWSQKPLHIKKKKSQKVFFF